VGVRWNPKLAWLTEQGAGGGQLQHSEPIAVKSERQLKNGAESRITADVMPKRNHNHHYDSHI